MESEKTQIAQTGLKVSQGHLRISTLQSACGFQSCCMYKCVCSWLTISNLEKLFGRRNEIFFQKVTDSKASQKWYMRGINNKTSQRRDNWCSYLPQTLMNQVKYKEMKTLSFPVHSDLSILCSMMSGLKRGVERSLNLQ